jgi:hypothetical protein
MADSVNSDLAAYYMLGGGAGGLDFDPSLLMDPRKKMQLAIAQKMMEGGTDTSPTSSPWAGLARVAGAVFGARNFNQLTEPTAATATPDTGVSDATIKKVLTPDDYAVYKASDNYTQWQYKTKIVRRSSSSARQPTPSAEGRLGHPRRDPTHQTSVLGPDEITALQHRYTERATAPV